MQGDSPKTATWLSLVVPTTCATDERNGSAHSLPSIYADEELLIAMASDKRKTQFRDGRACAHAALAQLGALPAPLLRRDDGRPAWPSGFVGSVTHCPGFVGAAVATTRDIAGVGIDAEPLGPVTADAATAVATPLELEFAVSALDVDRLVAARAVLSAKESVFKACSSSETLRPLLRDITVNLMPHGHLNVSLAQVHATDNPPLKGRWLTTKTHILTGVFTTPLRTPLRTW